MLKINENYLNIKGSYLFAGIAKKVREFSAANPDKKLISMGIGDVTLPLADAVVAEIKAAADEQGRADTFHGYGPEQGYDFLKNAIKDYYLKNTGVELSLNEIFVAKVGESYEK